MKVFWKRILMVVGLMLILAGIIVSVKIFKTKPVDRVYDKQVNYKTNPLGIETLPEFSWKMDSTENNQTQTAYRIVVAESLSDLKNKKYVWDSGKVENDTSVGIVYEGEALKAKQEYYWDVSIWNQDGKEVSSQKNDYSTFEIGLMDGDFQGAEWISVPKKEYNVDNSSNIFNIQFDINIDSSISGFIWGADKSDYENGYFCGFDTTGDDVYLINAKIENEELKDERRTALSQFGFSLENFKNKIHHVEINVSEKKVDILVDDVEVDSFSIDKANSVGLIGTFTERGEYTALFDNIKCVDSNGTIIYNEDFEGEKNIFSPLYTKIIDGCLQATPGSLVIPGEDEPAPVFEKSFELNNKKKIEKARLYASALGIYEVEINGETISDEYFAPGTSYYEDRIYYRTYDVTKMLQNENTIVATIGHGRYNRLKSNWGDTLAFMCTLEITYSDGEKQIIVTDESWDCYTDGPIRRDDYYWGEYIDHNYTLTNPVKAEIYKYDTNAIFAAFESEPVRAIEEIDPVTVTELENGNYVYDFGQNFSGYVKIAVKGEKNQIIKLRYSEILNNENLDNKDDEVGTVYTSNLFMAKDTDYFTLSGSDETEIFDPHFIYRGFRYVQVDGITDSTELESITAVVLSSDLERTGEFECSDEQINKIYNSIYWTQLSNFMDVATDCPQRDERFGWSGDFNVFSSTASYNQMTYNYFINYLDALYDNQWENGALPDMAFKQESLGGNSGWGDAGVTVPWLLYKQYGTKAPLTRYYDGMCRYVDYLVEDSENYLTTKPGYGDHAANSGAENAYCNTAESAYSAYIVWQTALVLNKTEDAAKYEKIYNSFKDAWTKAYLNEDGSIGGWTQSEYCIALGFNLYPDNLRNAGLEKLLISVNAGGAHPSTGYISTQFLLPSLSEAGATELAYDMLQETTYPGWGYMLSRGSTTINESWNAYLPVNDNDYRLVGSLNHYGLGSVGRWYYENILGIQSDINNPGYKHFYLKPQPGGQLTYAKGSYKSIYGAIESSWEYTKEGIMYRFTIPANTTATVTLPNSEVIDVEYGSGSYEILVRGD